MTERKYRKSGVLNARYKLSQLRKLKTPERAEHKMIGNYSLFCSNISGMKHLILKPSVSGHQKFILISFSILFFVLGGITTLWLLLFAFGLIPDGQLNFTDFLMVALFLGSFFLLAVAISKEGLAFDGEELSHAYFLFNKKLKSKPILTNGFSDISILRFNMSQKLAMGAAPNPDQSVDFAEYRICLLSENHGKRKLIFTCKHQDQARSVVEELSEQFGFKYANYNPPRSGKRRR